MNSNVAFLWDESFLWGLMAYKALRYNNLNFDLVRSQDIKAGVFENYRLLFVPGGWASNKLKTLGNEGIEAIKEFVHNGGNYLGFCGGAGLATADGIGLLNIKRKPTKDRVPSFSGRIYLNTNEHPIWQSVNRARNPLSVTDTKHGHDLPIFHAWWPSQFLVEDKSIKVLATFGDALPDAFSSDLNVGDIEKSIKWQELENIYQINLAPKRLLNKPAVVEGNFGKGKVVLSLIHFDTPEDENGARVLKSLWEYLSEQQSRRTAEQQNSETSNRHYCSTALLLCGSEIETAVEDLINFGIRNFLWFWRNPMLLQWRRGVRGLEYCTLYVMIKELVKILKSQESEVKWQELNRIKKLLMSFTEKARELLVLERLAMQNRHITYKKCDDPKIQEIRAGLFGGSKSHGGMFKKLLDEIDTLLYTLIKTTTTHL